MKIIELKDIDFPDCGLKCCLVEFLGAGECENLCPWKFDNGKPVDDKGD